MVVGKTDLRPARVAEVDAGSRKGGLASLASRLDGGRSGNGLLGRPSNQPRLPASGAKRRRCFYGVVPLDEVREVASELDPKVRSAAADRMMWPATGPTAMASSDVDGGAPSDFPARG